MQERVSPCVKVYTLCLQASQQLIIKNRVTVLFKIKKRDLGLGFNRKTDTLNVHISRLEQTDLLSGSELPWKF